MKKLISAAVLTAAVLTFAGCNGNAGGTDSGTLKVENVFVDYHERAEIRVELPEDAEGNVEYKFSGSDISISDGKVYGMTPDSSTIVYAVYNGTSTPFTVTVGKVFGKNEITQEYGGAFVWSDGGAFVKDGDAEGDDYVYLGGVPLNDDEYCASGTLEMSDCGENAEAHILVKKDEGNFLEYSLRYADSDTYSIMLHGSGFEDYLEIKTVSVGKINFALMLREGVSYFFLDNALVSKTDFQFDKPHLGFGGSGCTVRLSRLNYSRSQEVVDRVYKTASKTFGTHFYGYGSSSPGAFAEPEDGTYYKSSYSYFQAFVYFDCMPVAGTNYWLEGTLEMLNPDEGGNAVILMAKSDTEQLRYVLQSSTDGSYHVFRDKVTNGAFNSYHVVASAQSTIHFKFVYDGAYTYLYLDGALADKTACALGQTHLGFAGDKCQFTVSDLTAGYGE